MIATLRIVVNLADGADADATAERLFNYLAADPSDRFPEIVTVEDYSGRLGERP